MTAESTVLLFEDFSEFISKKSGRNSLGSAFLSLKSIIYGDSTDLRDKVVATSKVLLNEMSGLELYYCSDEMTDVIEQGARLLDYTDKADAALIPSPKGFCYFPKGVKLVSSEDGGESYITHAVVWVLAAPDSYFIISLNDSLVEQDDSSAKFREMTKNQGIYFDDTQRWTVNYVTHTTTGWPLAPKGVESMSSEELEKFAKLSRLTISVEALTHSLFLMLNQHTFVDSSTRIKTTHKKRLKRLESKNLPTETQVIQLRKRYYNSENLSDSAKNVDYSYRWFVVGHWRWQPYKNQETKEVEHKRIWISPYIKGPEDKPLKTTPKVFALVR
jgi:hypothetical protein